VALAPAVGEKNLTSLQVPRRTVGVETSATKPRIVNEHVARTVSPGVAQAPQANQRFALQAGAQY
jgi:hypothetical protein